MRPSRRSGLRSALPLAALALAVTAVAAPSAAETKESKNKETKGSPTMSVTSPKFGDGDRIPTLYTCMGSNLSPPLAFNGVPRNAKSLALVVDDPDAGEPPQRGFVNWIVYNMPASAAGLKEGAKAEADFPRGSREGINDAQRPQWSAPCPPSGTHHYVFHLYALDDTIPRQGMTKVDLENSMQGHVVASAQMVGLVTRQ